MTSKIGISSYSFVSASCDLLNPETAIQKHNLLEKNEWMGKLHPHFESQLEQLLRDHPYFTKLDRSVQLALLATHRLENLGQIKDREIGVNIGSSRGATAIWERDYSYFSQNQKSQVLTSPTTSLGNLSSWVGQYLGQKGIRFSHSMTCSTSLLSLLNGVAWLQSAMCDDMIVGGTEAPLTPFTLAQLRALRIYSNETAVPCRAGDIEKTTNTMVLGEAAGLLHLNRNTDNEFYINGFGFSSERIKHAIEISAEGFHFEESMKRALKNAQLDHVDAIVTHTPGTKKGDLSEINAIQNVFGENHPPVTNNKWKIGHTFGASGILSLIFALEMLRYQQLVPHPFDSQIRKARRLNHIMVNAAGFGGNAVSVIVGRKSIIFD